MHPRRSVAALAVAVLGVFALTSCGGDEDAAETLPPIRTTTTSSTTTTTLPTDPVEYEIQPGDTLGIIAEKNGVSIEAIVAFNQLEGNGDYIQAGQIIEIPPPNWVPPSTTTTLPAATSATSAAP